MIVAVVVVEVARGREFAVLWNETLMIALAHYFTTRRFIHLPVEVLRRLEEDGYLERESHPLYLPRHSIRALVVLAFIGVAVYLYQEDRLFTSQALSILGLVFSYLIGIVVRAVTSWWARGRPKRATWWWDDLKAGIVLVVMAVTTAAYLLDRPELLPHQLRNVTLGLVLFYFGSR
jgi:hypothetical protein